MDTVFKNLEDLKAEKHRLEKLLAGTKQKRQSMEKELERANVRFDQVQEKHCLLSEQNATLRGKLEQSMACISSIQSSREEGSQKLDQLQTAIDSENDSQINDVDNFNIKLSEIATELFKAKNSFTKDRGNDEIEDSKNLCCKFEEGNSDLDQEVKDLNQALQDMEAQFNQAKSERCGVENTISVCCRVLQQDISESEPWLKDLREELEALKQEMAAVHMDE